MPEDQTIVPLPGGPLPGIGFTYRIEVEGFVHVGYQRIPPGESIHVAPLDDGSSLYLVRCPPGTVPAHRKD